ncbi:MAG: DUF3558 family protein [Candidatus Eisenbacteria bacterium]|nr:DUF3558 family protein [Candidatus Eisenbacteria bacterium]
MMAASMFPGGCRSLLSLVLLGPFFLMSCGGERPATDAQPAPQSSADRPAPAAVSAAPTNPCTLISPEEAQAATGIAAEGSSSTSGGAAVCSWIDATGKSAVVQIFPTASGYEVSRRAFESFYDATAEIVSGLGDEACYITGKTASVPTATFCVRKGSAAASVQVMTMGQDAAALKDQALALTRTLVAKL